MRRPLVSMMQMKNNFTTRNSVAELIGALSKTPVDWHSKDQAVVENSTCGSEHSSDRTCMEQASDLRINLRRSGVPIREKICILGDNGSAANRSANHHVK